MGACDFKTFSNGSSMNDAFRSATEDARWEYGHGGYSGTIAEKREAVEIVPPDGVDPDTYADWLLYSDSDPNIPAQYLGKVERDARRVKDKWGPAGAIKLSTHPETGVQEWVFFGYASS